MIREWWSGSRRTPGVITYNCNLVPQDKTPKGWDSCLDPYFKSKFSVDPKPNILTWLAPRWGEEKLISYARPLKENDPVFGRGNTRNITQLVSGEVVMNCGMYIHVVKRTLRQDPSAPIKMVVPDPFPMSAHEPEAIYVNSKNPHAALLWIEFLASKEGQDLAEEVEQGIEALTWSKAR
jgi:iron(III) transport system substrate-binding protein